jgi:hypothetical protein
MAPFNDLLSWKGFELPANVGIGTQCYLGDCGDKCKPGYIATDNEVCCDRSCDNKKGSGRRRTVCCRISAQPDSRHCRWEIGDPSLAKLGVCVNTQCKSTEVAMVQSADAPYNGGMISCYLGGKARYCCELQMDPVRNRAALEMKADEHYYRKRSVKPWTKSVFTSTTTESQLKAVHAPTVRSPRYE